VPEFTFNSSATLYISIPRARIRPKPTLSERKMSSYGEVICHITTNRLHFYSLIPHPELQPFHPVGPYRRHFCSLIRSTRGLDCARFGDKMPRGLGHVSSFVILNGFYLECSIAHSTGESSHFVKIIGMESKPKLLDKVRGSMFPQPPNP
jgi:hypothetical protein